jgi:HK97 family phage major capsid protein
MPYIIRKQDGEYCVYKEGADGEPVGETLGCHETRQEALEQVRVLYASEAKAAPATTIKRLDGNRVGGYGVVWGDPERTDLEGDYFTPHSNFFMPPRQLQPGERVKVHWPMLYNHAQSELPRSQVKDGDARDYLIGTIDQVLMDDVGLWVEGQIEAHNDWVERVLDLVKRGVLHWSSGSVPHMVRREADGWLKCWPIVEMSATPTPAEPRHTGLVLKHYARPAQREAAPVQGARVLEGEAGLSLEPKATTGDNTMKLTPEQARTFIRAYAEAERDTIAAAVKQAEGSNMIAEALRPLAEQLAEMAGVSVEVALAELVAFVASHVAPQEEAAPEEEAAMAEQATLSVQLDKLVQESVAKALRELLPAEPRGGALAGKRVNLNLSRDDRPLTLGRWIKAVAERRYDVLEREHQRIKAEHKALGIDPDTAGGYLVPVEQSNQVIELLRADSVVLPLCRQLPLNRPTLTIPTQTGGATAYWVGENSTITASEPTFGQITLIAKKLGILVKLSNELLEDSDPAIDALIREDIARVAALEIDRVILEGSGLGGEPRGILYSGATTTPLNAKPTYAALSAAVYRVEAENVMPEPRWAWVFNPREKATLRQLEDTAGNLIFAGPGPAQQALGGAPPSTLLDYPWYTTTQIAIDGTNETRMYFGQWNDVIVGMRKSLEIMASNQAGTAFADDQTWIRAILRMDVALRHPESIEVLTDVQP